MKVSVLYFAQARDATGTGREVLKVPSRATVETLLSQASLNHPRLAAMKRSIRVAINLEVVEERAELQDGDEVALLPPVVGG